MPYRAFDKIEARCPQLGGEVSFGYCRAVNDGLPCPKALVCFEHKFPVVTFFQKILTEEAFSRCFETPGPSRLERLFKAVAEADKATEKD